MSRAAGDAHAEEVGDAVDADHVVGASARQRRAGAAAERLPLRQQQPEDLGDHPGADGEIGARAGGRRRSAVGKASSTAATPAEQDGDQRIEAGRIVAANSA